MIKKIPIYLLFICWTIMCNNITVAQTNPDSIILLEIRSTIKTSADDAEELISNGRIELSSSDLEMVDDKNTGAQIVGLRYTDLPLTKNMDIQSAYIQFSADTEISWGATEITITGETSGNAAPFEATNFNLSNRSLTENSVVWQASDWVINSERNENHQTTDLTSIITEIIQQPDWKAGNDLALLLTGTGRRRIAAAYDLNPQQAAELVIQFAYRPPTTALENVYINELMAANSTVFDEYGEADDWIEIYNDSDIPLVLNGFYLTDDLENLQKWKIESSTIIAPKGHALIWADDEPEQGDLHAPFKLKSGGETVALVQELEGEFYVLDSITFPNLLENISYGRKEDGQNEWVLFTEVSPEESNNDNGQYAEVEVQFSEAGGLYGNEINLEMMVNDPSFSIYYTLDGSTPTPQSFLYETPISLNHPKQVSARAFKTGFVGAKVTKAFYVVNDPSEMAILNVQSDPKNFWDEETGIYVKGTNGALDYCDNVLNNWNQDWERPCQLTFYEPDGTDGFQVNAGMKIGGACSRNLAMKSLNFYLRTGTYGDKSIEYPIFSNSQIDEFKRLKIRNSGTDWREMLFRDGMNQLLLKNKVDIDLMDYRPLRVYFNGQFWGIYGMRELFNEHYIESHHGVDKDSVDILGDPSGPRSNVKEGSFTAYQNMIDYIDNNGLKEEIHYQAVSEMMDIKEFINYYIAQIYLANYDWPGNNVRVWRDQNDGKFRWMLFDTDASAGWQSWGSQVAKPNHNSLAHSLNTGNVNTGVPGFTEWPNGAGSTYLFRKLMDNEAFKNEFIQRTCSFRELIFNAERVLPMVDSMQALYLPEMDRHIRTWLQLERKNLGKGSPSGGSITTWNRAISEYKQFYTQREELILDIYQNELNLDQRFRLTIKVDELTNGKVVLHQNEMDIPYNYQGEYFSKIPIKIKAIPDEGYTFSHWLETGNTNAAIDFVVTGNAILTPVFTDQLVNTKEAFLAKNITLYPNPTKDFLWIDFVEIFSKTINIKLVNSVGQTIIQKEIPTSSTQKLSIPNFSEGIYWLILTDIKQGTIMKKVIIQK